MSQIALTNPERAAALERLGYSEREAQFLLTAALHGGYFLRRQYAHFLGCQDGGSVTQLIEKALNRGDAEAATYKGQTHIYHLAARRFYGALGQEDNRNRRRKEPVTIKTRLMGLDFVLNHPDENYLATEQEKIGFFVKALGVDRDTLPLKRYVGSGQVTERYFVEKYPIFCARSSEAASPPVVSFCFIDPGQASVDGLETFLDRYRRLFANLREFHLVYVAATSALYAKAQAAFASFTGRGLTHPVEARDPALVDYFETRQLYESRQFASFNREKLLRLRDLRQRFSGPEIEAFYGSWKTGRDGVQSQDLTAHQGLPAGVTGHFSTYLLEHSYDLFGSLTTY